MCILGRNQTLEANAVFFTSKFLLIGAEYNIYCEDKDYIYRTGPRAQSHSFLYSKIYIRTRYSRGLKGSRVMAAL